MKVLKAEYKRRSHLRPLLWDSTLELPLDDVYTRLKIVSRRKADFRVDDNEVNVFDIFTALDIGEDVMTLVEGSPGIGKTTFCLKLAYDWAHGKIPAEYSFPKFELVLLLKCRDIHEDIMESISEQLLPGDIEEKTKGRLFDFIKDIHNQEKTLIILDGLDELPKDSERYVDKLLQRRILSFCYVLATSRQERGIDARKKYGFDILLEIKGFTESDSFDYIRKHFKNVGPLHSPKGESLIKEIKENTLLHALRNNPLNLLLLCVIYEDYEGNLPSSRSELYQIIVLCLLKRYCAKHNPAALKDYNDLEKQFEDTILALGELAWLCLLSDRYCFRESELAALERRYKGLVSRHIGLVYKEESLRRLMPQHEYYFLHKTFQEYLAAVFIAHKLRGNQLRLFERLSFHELVKKFREVFLFVSGILGSDANILVTQIGEELKNWGEWEWETCEQSGVVMMDDRESEENWDNWYSSDDDGRGWEAATFFTESFSESGHAEKMAETLCSYIPFPTQIVIDIGLAADNIYHVLEACKTFANVQKPVRLTVCDSLHMRNSSDETFTRCIQSCSQLQTLTICTPATVSNLANALHNGLSGNKTLSEFILQVRYSIRYDEAVAIGKLFAACKTCRKVTFHLDRVWGETWAKAIEPALCADSPLKSVNLQVRGSLSDTAVYGLGKLLSNKALTSFSLNIFGDMQEWEAAALSRGIARQTAVKSLDLSVNGKLSLSCANVLQNSLLENRSLNDLVLIVRGEIPDNWQSVVENLRSVKKGSVSCTFHPDPGSSVTCDQVAHFCPAVVEKGLETKQHLTVVIWGELKCDGAEALCEVLVRAPLTSLRLKLYGKLSDGVATIIERYVRGQNTLHSLTIDIWDEFASGTETLLQELSRNNEIIRLKLHGVSVPKEECNALDVSIDNPASLTPVFSEVKNTRKERINLKIINHDVVISDWPRLLGDALAENTSLTTLDLTVINYTMNPGIGKDLGDSLLRSSSLTVLSLTISSYGNMAKGWECTLINSLAKMASLTTLSLSIDDRGKVRKFGEGLMAVKSLSTLSVVINGSKLTYFWGKFLMKCLEECNSLQKLCLTSNNYKEKREINPYNVTFDPFSYINSTMPVTWVQGLSFGLASTTSLKELNMTINNVTCSYSDWREVFLEGLAQNESITSLTVTVSDYEYLSCEFWVHSLKECLAKNNSLTTLTLTVNYYGEAEVHGDWSHQLRREMFPENSSLTELNLTVNIRSEVSEDWLPTFCDYLMRDCSSLRTVRLQVNNRCATSKSRIYDLSKLRLKYRSLSTFELSVTFYGE